MGSKLYNFVRKNYLNILCISLIMILTGVFMIKPIMNESTSIETKEKEKSIQSDVIKTIQMRRVEEVRKAEEEKRKAEEEKKRQEEEKKRQEEAQRQAASVQPSVQARATNVLSSGSGRVTYYGLNGGNVACGARTVNSLYSDPTYGNVRGLAAGSEFPFGTIININGSGLGSFTGIVLDRGGAIGMGRRNMFDILVNSEAEAYRYGVSYVTYEVLRMGW